MQSAKQAGAEARAMVAAAYMGVLVGLSLGPVYLLSGLGHAVEDHARAVRIAAAAEAERAAEAREERLAALAPLAPPPGVTGSVGATLRPAKVTRARELDCLAQAVYFEARGETPRGQAAVATVIMNRVKNPNFPKTVCGVVYQGASHRNGCQFSFACDGIASRVVEWSAWERARKVAAQALSGIVLRDIGSATHYHTIDAQPGWGARMLRVAQVGLHVFYRFNPHAPPPVVEAEADDDEATQPAMPLLPALPSVEPRLEAAVSAPPVAAAAAPAATPVAAPAAPSAPPSGVRPAAVTIPAPSSPAKLPDKAVGAIAKTSDAARPATNPADAT